jgi:NTE family protein
LLRNALWRATCLAVVACLVGCVEGGGDFTGPQAPRFEAPRAAQPRLALVLGSGGARGFAHIGVLKVLDENGIRPDLIVGASVGALVGALYASGMSGVQIEKVAYDLGVLDLFDFNMIMKEPATGRRTQEIVSDHVGARMIEQLPIPFAATATRERDRALVIFNRGDAGIAVRASAASPGQFEPVRISGENYVDGDESSPVPIRAARRLGARVVIAVDVSAYVENTPAGMPSAWIAKDARRAKQVAAEAPEADVLIHPNIGYFAGRSEEYRHRVIAAAERAARARLPELLAAAARAASK